MPTKTTKKSTWIDRQTTIRLLYISVTLFACAAVLLVLSLYIETHHQRVVTSQATTGYPVGTSLSQGVATVKLESVSYVSGTGHFTTPAGKKYAVMTIRIKNRSDTPINVLPTSDIYVKDAAGNTVYLTPFSLNAPFHAGELPAGDTVGGELSYIVPSNGPLKLYIDAIWSGGVLIYTLR